MYALLLIGKKSGMRHVICVCIQLTAAAVLAGAMAGARACCSCNTEVNWIYWDNPWGRGDDHLRVLFTSNLASKSNSKMIMEKILE